MKSKRSLILFLIICIMTCVGIFTLTACGTNKPNNPDNNQGTNHSAPVAGHFELDEKPLLYNNVIISKLDYDFYLDGGVEATIYVSAQNGYSTIEHKIGRYTWTEGTDLIYISWSDSSEVIDLLYTDKYITNGTYICNFKCANDKGEVAGKLICADYLTKTEKWYELNTTGGTISGGKTQYIKKGGDALTVTAVANDGFEFVGWSDGVNTAERTDKNLTSNLKITAKFKQVKDIFKLEYSAGQGGTLTGKDYQEIVEEKTASSVIAVPDAGNDEYGYEFIGWSDGVTTAERCDMPKNNITAQAQFVRIGTKENPFRISSLQDLRNMEKHPKAYYVLTENIVLSSSENFTPLFSEDNPFLGELDGKGYKITNLKIYNETSEYTGLIAYAGHEIYFEREWTGVVKNLSLENVNIRGRGNVGAVVGFSNGLVNNCSVQGNICALTGETEIGGIAGNVIQANNCTVDVKITTSDGAESITAGGIAGKVTDSCSESTANVAMDITATTVNVGGVFGYADGLYSNLSSSGSITVNCAGTYDYVGGAIGYVHGQMSTSYRTVVSESHSSCEITLNGDAQSHVTYCGGLVGYISDGMGFVTDLVENCYATGNITVSGNTVYAGGLVGSLISDVKCCYATGDVTAKGNRVYAGGLVGSSYSITASFSTGTVTVNAKNYIAVGGLVGNHNDDLISSYTVSKVITSGNAEEVYVGGVTGLEKQSSSFGDYKKVYWLYYSAYPAEKAVGAYLYDYGGNKNGIKCTALAEFKNIASALNEELESAVWENTSTLPKLNFGTVPDVPDVPDKPVQNYTLTYTASKGGKIIGALSQTIESGKDGSSIIAVANEGYEFIGWSDGVQTAERQDTNVSKNITVTAQFKEILKYTLTYVAADGGMISGQLTQTVLENTDGSAVIAIANEGYEFIGWSDGVQTAERQDTSVSENITVTAQFKEILKYTLTYVAAVGGTISGQLTQTVLQNTDGSAVIAIANEGYEFIGWSDGVQAAERQDTSVSENITVTAQFELINTDFAGGNGTEARPYQIETAEQLRAIEKYPQAHFILINDISLENSFCSMFTDENMFNGVFDGNEHKITNLTIYNDKTFYTGLFACIGENGAVKNLTLESVDISGINYVGGISGYSLGSIENCNVSGNINYLSKNSYKVFIGGIVGRIEAKINQCTTNVEILCSETNNDTYLGGIAGYLDCDDLATSGMKADGDIVCENAKSTIYVGGLVGYNYSSITIIGSVTTGAITATGDLYDHTYAGGLVGYSSSSTTINDSYTMGKITATGGSAYAGGFVGHSSSSITINDSYTTGEITATGGSAYTGGFIGHCTGQIDIMSAYSVSKISAIADEKIYSGAFAGYAVRFKLNNAHWLYYGDSGVEYAIGYGDSMGIPSNIGATKHTDISDFYTLADLLNNGLDVPVWENIDETSLPTLKHENEEE